ncbi:YrdB family protein [Planosporangium sp. 12N6]|uniref:YrdB family protein n=1 Tax=Planosporangium spinosum TaxID=3402278 RepID=UPI003CF55D91
MRYANLALRFALELAGLAAFGYWGFVVGGGLGTKLLLGLGAPVVAAVLWGLFASPKAAVALPGPARLGFEVLWFGGAAAALVRTGRPWLAVVLAALYAANRTLLSVYRD